ncbi:MAG: HD domain-containing protein [Gemmatimonadota bacterium]|nr:MAG: HD domain-containing protein [Gemmatimonadota bacterium]
MPQRSALETVKWHVYVHFEKVLVVGLVLSLLLIHWFVDYKVAFLSFYYLPIIVAGFFLGRNTAVSSAVLIVGLVLFFQAVQGLEATAGLTAGALFTLVPWGGFLILTGYVVGGLADQRQHRLRDLKAAYMAVLELLTFHLESSEKAHRGHSHRVAKLATLLGKEIGLREEDVENLRLAALLHEVGPRDPRLLRLLSEFPGAFRELPVASAMRGAFDILQEYERYYEVVGDDWPLDHLPFLTATKILAVADGFETLQMHTPLRPAFAPWTAIEEMEKGVGKTFAREIVAALRKVSAAPQRSDADVALSLLKADSA